MSMTMGFMSMTAGFMSMTASFSRERPVVRVHCARSEPDRDHRRPWRGACKLDPEGDAPRR